MNSVPPVTIGSTHTSARGPVAGERSFSTEEFYASIWETKPQVAVFDCDGTLWSGDAGSGFMDWTIKTGLLSPKASKQIAERHDVYHAGGVDELAICGEMVSIYAGIAEEKLRASARAFFLKHVEENIFPEMVALLQELQASGVEIWAVSSTNNWMIEEALRGLGITHEKILAACVEVKDGVATETLRDVPTDEYKAVSLRRVGIEKPDIVFGNSIHDAAMLEMATRAFPVNPSEGLQKLAAQKGWPVYYPAAVRHW